MLCDHNTGQGHLAFVLFHWTIRNQHAIDNILSQFYVKYFTAMENITEIRRYLILATNLFLKYRQLG